MPNHFHFVIEASHQQSLSRFMQWLLTGHVRRYQKHYVGRGHVWQGRFKSFPVRRDEHLLMVQRYVLQNPVRSGLAASINDWTMVKLVSERRDKTSLDIFWAERRKPRGIRQCQRTDALTDEIAAP
jgi:hypothetical protein